ncbi:unnamed protein product [Rotaria magnacalcarata]|uniref:Uncharacterized protein n=1 Tax=Rotaria magnacalcarata TaxID=392030 RepID=A0A8S2PXF1_9BILA|nr:unnamed protein product [Rotaria magnacalcarata]
MFKLWVGGLASAVVIIIVISAYNVFNRYFQQYPIEQITTMQMTSSSPFICNDSLIAQRVVGAIRLGLTGPSMISTDKRSTLLELNFSSAFVSSSSDEALAPSSSFVIGLTAIVNQTDPLNSDD